MEMLAIAEKNLDGRSGGRLERALHMDMSMGSSLRARVNHMKMEANAEKCHEWEESSRLRSRPYSDGAGPGSLITLKTCH